MTLDRFDPDGAAVGDGIFGLPFTPEEARVVLIPVPWEATVSYGAGTANGPAAILSASRQVDLFDRETGRPYEAGIAMLPIPEEVAAWNQTARAMALPILSKGGASDALEDRAALAEIDVLTRRMNAWVYAKTREVLHAGKLPGVVGGDHASPFGGIEAAAERFPGLGILHVDAHADLRDAYEGFAWSHASIFHNVMTRLPRVGRLVQVGIRDFSGGENAFLEASGGRIATFFEADVRARLFSGEGWGHVAEEIVAALPRDVWVSFDIDGLDPALCPHTGTPVPGGLSFAEATALFRKLAASGRRVVGFDLSEVAPDPTGASEWDGNVAARLLYKLIGFALRSAGSGAAGA